MREIKFRAWDSYNKKILNIKELRFDKNHTNCNTMLCETGTVPKFLISHSNPIMQYTGLKDKNGKEGYHHDLLSHAGRNQGIPIEIIWDDGSWKGQYLGSDFMFNLNHWEMSEAEIIGNIYENPKLLTEDQEKVRR